LLAWRIGLLKGSVRRTSMDTSECDSLTVCRPRRWRSIIGIWVVGSRGRCWRSASLCALHTAAAARPRQRCREPERGSEGRCDRNGDSGRADGIWTGCAWRDGPAVWWDRGTAEHLPPRIQLWPHPPARQSRRRVVGELGRSHPRCSAPPTGSPSSTSTTQ
jgi:hypothetical protein